MLAGHDEGAVAFDRPRQRAQLAMELNLVEHKTGIARVIHEYGTAVLDIQTFDCNRFEVEAKLRDRPRQMTGRVKPGRELRSLEPSVGDAPCAPHQGPERKLDSQSSRAHLAALVRTTELNALQHEGWRRKQTGIDCTCDAEVETGQAARPGLELAAIPAPIDENGSDQRCHQRQDDRNRETEQRRLHAVSTAGLAKVHASRMRADPGKSPITRKLNTIQCCRARAFNAPRLDQAHHAPHRNASNDRDKGPEPVCERRWHDLAMCEK